MLQHCRDVENETTPEQKSNKSHNISDTYIKSPRDSLYIVVFACQQFFSAASSTQTYFNLIFLRYFLEDKTSMPAHFGLLFSKVPIGSRDLSNLSQFLEFTVYKYDIEVNIKPRSVTCFDTNSSLGVSIIDAFRSNT
jgi:hypothetical protein